MDKDINEMEISDEELDAVSGGLLNSMGKTIVLPLSRCNNGKYQEIDKQDPALRNLNRFRWFNGSPDNSCARCVFLKFQGSTGYCGAD